MRWIAVSLLAAGLCVPSASGAEVVGADAAIKKIQNLVQQPAKPESQAEATNLAEVNKQIKNLESTLEKLTPDEHAQQWLRLYDSLAKVASERESYESRQSIEQLFQLLPPPAAWKKMGETINARKIPEDAREAKFTYALRILSAVLANDQKAIEAEQKAWAELAKKAGPSRGRFAVPSGPFEEGEARFNPYEEPTGEPAEQVAKVEKLLEMLPPNQEIPLHLPDITATLDAEKAAALADKILQKQEISEIRVTAPATKKLLKERAIALGEKVSRPHWDMIEGTDDLALYDVFSKKLKKASGPIGQFFGGNRVAETIPQAAENILLTKLLDEDKLDEAKQIVLRRADDLLKGDEDQRMPRRYRHHGRADANDKLFAGERGEKYLRLLEDAFQDRLADLPWEEYLQLAIRQTKVEPIQKFAATALASDKVPAERKAEIADAYFEYLLGKELTTDSIEILRKYLLVETPRAANRRNGDDDKSVEHALKLNLLGDLLDKPEWQTEGLAAAEKAFAAKLARGSDNDYQLVNEFDSLLHLLVKAERYADAERLAIETMAASLKNRDQERHHYSSANLSQAALKGLCVVYDKLNRRDEILKLLATAPWWETTKLSDLLVNEHRNSEPFGVILARAFADAKKTDKALQILDVMINRNPGLDPAYELLIGLDPAGALKKLDVLAKLDPYQERPLIWKAKLLLDQGQLAEAGQTIRKAITIDPSDGEQGKNTRMYGYKVFAEVLRKEGDEETAKVFDGAIAAIRKSERADDFRSAGLHSIARKMYKDSLNLFNDAYCIQSRLAIQLYEAGDLEQAAIHFERAFQLMPGSFGMIESHCFGCEGAFAGELAQELAEKIFLRLLQEDPKKPQVHYLLGYLRSSQDRPREALKHYQEAVRLAPPYLNAWEKLAQIAGRYPEHAQLHDDAICALLKLDPQQRHTRVDGREVKDLAKFWNAFADAQKRRVAPPVIDDELAGTKAEQQRLEAEASTQDDDRAQQMNWMRRQRSMRSSSDEQQTSIYPGKMLERNERLQQVQQMLQ